MQTTDEKNVEKKSSGTGNATTEDKGKLKDAGRAEKSSGNSTATKKSTVSEIESLLSGYTEELNVNDDSDLEEKKDNIEIPLKKKTRRTKKQAIVSGDILSGAMFLFLIDTIFPSIICAVNNRFSDKKVSPEKLMLTAAQKKELEPLAQQVAEQLQAKGDPGVMFAITLLSLYGLNLMMVRAND